MTAWSRARACTLMLVPLLAAAAPAQPAQPFFPPFGLDLAARDLSVRPADDFFQYENGAWLARTPIPADLPSISMGREDMIRVEARVHALLEDAAARDTAAAPATTAGKTGAMYAAFMDEARVNALGAAPIAPQIAAIRAADKDALARMMGEASYRFGMSFFAPAIDVDLKDNAHYAVYLGQSGLGLPDRDYYLKPGYEKALAAYRQDIAAQLGLVGWADPAGSADAVIALERRIAEASWTKEQQRDLPALYNPMTPAELAAYAPGFPWASMLAGARLGAKPRVVVNEKTAFPRIAAIFADTPVATLRAWLAFHAADQAAPRLSRPFQDAYFAFHNQALQGQAAIAPRWKRGVLAVSGTDCLGGAQEGCFGTLGWAVGQLYVAHDFTPDTKARVQALVANLLAAYRQRIQALEWMSPATKQEALAKLDTYTVKVGYPDHQRDYARVAIRRDDLIGDTLAAAAADWDFYVGRSDGPVDRTDWQMTPQTADAYNGSLRDIVFPAGILQRSSYDPLADDATNYGAIGAIIGHELTHGFDDQGRTLDAKGELRDWWTPADAAAFKARATVLGQQYAQFEPVPGLHIKPDLTMGENIADLGGVLIALDAYHRSLGGRPAPVIGGLTGDQRFFMAFAQGWRGKAREDAIRQATTSDPHSYRKFRVLGVLPNVDAWYAAFGVKPGDRMYRAPDQRARIW